MPDGSPGSFRPPPENRHDCRRLNMVRLGTPVRLNGTLKPPCSARFSRDENGPTVLQMRTRCPTKSASIGLRCHKLDEANVLKDNENVRATPHDAE